MSFNSSSGYLSMGPNSYSVSMKGLFQGNRDRVVGKIQQNANIDGNHLCVLYMVGGENVTRFDSDHEPLFRQESYFWYLTGVAEPDCRFLLDVQKNRSVLLIPRLPADYATIMGRIKTPEEWKTAIQVDEVFYTDEAEKVLEKMLQITPDETEKSDNQGADSKRKKILVFSGKNSDSGKTFDTPKVPESLCNLVDDELLSSILPECRVIKSEAELALLKHVTQVTSFAHGYVMRNMKPGMMEYQGESLFRHYCYFNYGCRLTGYTPICGCGPNAAVLHYGHTGEPNARQIKDGDICLFDMGAELYCYDSDVTCSFPINGKFNELQIPIYKAVLNAQIAVYNKMKPGVSYVDCHKAAELEILKGLADIGIVLRDAGKTLEELVDLRLGAVFMPHGLGHFIGIDTHDVGGYLPGQSARIMEPGLKSLRTARVLEKNMTLTVEPGCYFIDHLLGQALAEDSVLRPYLNASLVERYRGFGGVRLEDVVAVTENGCTNYTLCPRTIAEVEAVMRGENWPPVRDEAPELRREGLTGPIPLPSPLSL